MQTVCTIITADYLPLAKVLHASLQKHLPGTSLQVLVVDENNYTSTESLIIHSIDSLANSAYFSGIQKKIWTDKCRLFPLGIEAGLYWLSFRKRLY